MKPNYCSDEYFFETAAENRAIVDAITEIAKGLAKKELTRELESMAEKIDALSEELDYYKNFKEEKFKLEQEINRLKFENNLQYSKGYEAAKNEKLSTLLNILQGYTISYSDTYVSEKCDKCDNDRYIHFKSPLGTEFTERCDCAKTKREYHINEDSVDCIVLERGNFKYAYFKPHGWQSEHYINDYIYIQKDFKNVDTLIQEQHTSFRNVVFATREDAQKYIEWLKSREE